MQSISPREGGQRRGTEGKSEQHFKVSKKERNQEMIEARLPKTE
jgi:hypothetical protein